MSATLRIELFPASLPAAIDFYTRVLGFTILRHEPDTPSPSESPSTTGYAHIRRSTIQIGLSTKPASSYPPAARESSARAQFRTWPTGVEIVIEVNDVFAERERIVREGCTLESDMKLQEWGLHDFRVVDPDGYYIRMSERGGEDGKAVDL